MMPLSKSISRWRRTDPQWYAFAENRDHNPGGERDLRFGFGDADDANEYLQLLNKRYDGRYEMRPLSQAMGNLLAYDEMPTEEELEAPDGPGFEFNDPAGWADIDPEMWEAWLKGATNPEMWEAWLKAREATKKGAVGFQALSAAGPFPRPDTHNQISQEQIDGPEQRPSADGLR
jgi:hypothetical protein